MNLSFIVMVSAISLSAAGCQKQVSMPAFMQQSDVKGLYANHHFFHMSASEQIMVMGFMRHMAPKFNQAMQYMAQHKVRLGTGGEIPASHILHMNNVGKCSLYFNDNQFSVGYTNKTCIIPKYDTDDVLSELDQKTICQYLAVGKIGISRGSDGHYLLRSYIPGHGGNALFSWIARGLFTVGCKFATWGSAIINAITVGQAIDNVSRAVQPHIPVVAQTVVNTVERGADQMARYMGYVAAEGAPSLGNMIHAGITSQVTEHMGSVLSHGGNLVTAGIAEWGAARFPEAARDIAVANASNPQFLVILGQFLNFASIVVRF